MNKTTTRKTSTTEPRKEVPVSKASMVREALGILGICAPTPDVCRYIKEFYGCELNSPQINIHRSMMRRAMQGAMRKATRKESPYAPLLQVKEFANQFGGINGLWEQLDTLEKLAA